VNIITADGVRYLTDTKERYDVIYLDAFLKPSQDTDATGKPLAMKTLQFYQQVRTKLTPKGLVVFNLNPHPEVDADLRTIRHAFAQTYALHTADTNIIVLGSPAAAREEPAALRQRAKELDRRFKTPFSFQDLLRNLAR
jgi:spermidine synthase